jgi:uncharacterized protein
MSIEYNFPYQIDRNGRTATIDLNDHISQMIEQVLFTMPGERVNQPTLGTNVKQLVFSPLSDEMATATRLIVQGALQQWLGNIIILNSVQVTVQESTIQVQVLYTVRSSQQQNTAQFTGSV